MNTTDNNLCPITGLIAQTLEFIGEEYLYSIDIEKNIANTQVIINQRILLPNDYKDWDEDVFFKSNRHILAGLILNELLFEFNENIQPIPLDLLKRRIKECIYPQTPQEKYDNLFLKLFELQEYDGQELDSSNNLSSKRFNYKKLYFKTENECSFYAQALHKAELIEGDFIEISSYSGGGTMIKSVKVTYKGLSHALKLQSEGSKSKNCFVAMSFSEEMKPIREAIKEACSQTRYTPVLVDEVHYDSDTTINDSIIANLRKSRFCIADFTEQKNGVYFESGFALGQGKQVIYSCRKDWFDKCHFDTNHFPHIVYENTSHLTQALIDKIDAWIN